MYLSVSVSDCISVLLPSGCIRWPRGRVYLYLYLYLTVSLSCCPQVVSGGRGAGCRVEPPSHSLARVGSRAAMGFAIAFLRRAWRSGEDTDICSDLLKVESRAHLLSLREERLPHSRPGTRDRAVVSTVSVTSKDRGGFSAARPADQAAGGEMR